MPAQKKELSEEEKQVRNQLKLQKYRNARNDYRTIAINQLSFANNLLLTLAVGLLTLGIDKKDFETLSLCPNDAFSWSKFFLVLFLVLMLLSILWGVLVMFSRLYDFRVTRYILEIRIKIMEKYGASLGYKLLEETTRKKRWKSFWTIGRNKMEKFSQDAINGFYPGDNSEDSFNGKFTRLREIAKNLGSASMVWVKYQAVFFIIGVICFLVYLVCL